VILLLGCSSQQAQGPTEKAACTDPRPEFCHKARRPVCATRDNGVRCVTTPCDSTEEKTYANECLACADPAVYSYRTGACSD